MRFPVLSFLLLFCTFANAQQNTAHTLVHQGYTRNFLVHTPPGYNPAIKYPVVFVLHGGGLGTGPQVQNNSGMDKVADTAKFITVYPDALNTNWADGRSNQSDDAGIDDVGFVSAMIDFLLTSYSIDATMVYSCGMSNGAFMSNRLAIDLSDRIAAIGAVAGTMGESLAQRFPPANPMPFIGFHGTSDTYVPYNGGAVLLIRGNALGAEEVAGMYAGFGGCGVTPVITDITNSNLLDMSTVKKYTYTNCNSGTEVVLFKINNGGHTWPGGTRLLTFGSTNMDINASAELWKFFKTKKRPGAPTVAGSASSAVSETLSHIYPNPATTEITVQYLGKTQLVITDKSGVTYPVKVTGVQGKNKKIDVSGLRSGEYVLKFGDKTERFWIR
ncbi:MAG: T9SS type A sorting domain-containing protein [Bacteroidota bacterium]